MQNYENVIINIYIYMNKIIKINIKNKNYYKILLL